MSCERNQLILAHRDQRRRRAHQRRVHAMQIDRLAQRQESLGAVLLHIVVAAREQVILDRESGSRPSSRTGAAAEAQLELDGAAVGRHGERARQLETRTDRRRARWPRARSAAARCATRSTAPAICRRRSARRCGRRAPRGAPRSTAPPCRRTRRRRWHAADPIPRCSTMRSQGVRLIVGAQRRKFAVRLGRRAAAAAAEIVDAENAVLAACRCRGRDRRDPATSPPRRRRCGARKCRRARR